MITPENNSLFQRNVSLNKNLRCLWGQYKSVSKNWVPFCDKSFEVTPCMDWQFHENKTIPLQEPPVFSKVTFLVRKWNAFSENRKKISGEQLVKNYDASSLQRNCSDHCLNYYVEGINVKRQKAGQSMQPAAFVLLRALALLVFKYNRSLTDRHDKFKNVCISFSVHFSFIRTGPIVIY